MVRRPFRCDHPDVAKPAGNGAVSTLALLTGLVAVAVLVVGAVSAGAGSPSATALTTGVDVAVGVALVGAGVAAVGSVVPRLLLAGAGAAWLLASTIPAARLLHLAVLLVALAAYPRGLRKGPLSWGVVVFAGLIGLQLLPQGAVAAALAAAALVLLLEAGRGRGPGLYAPVAVAALAGAVALSWAAHRFRLGHLDPPTALLVYEATLLLVAAGFVSATRTGGRPTDVLTDQLLSHEQVGLSGLTAALRLALRDPTLQVRLVPEPFGVTDPGGRQMPVADELGAPVAVVHHRCAALDDARTAAAVVSSVRLAVRHLRLKEDQARHLQELEAARTRLLAAADRAREQAAADLRSEVGPALDRASARLHDLAAQTEMSAAAAAIRVVDRELAAARDDVAALVAGTPPDLGGGRLAQALRDLGRRSPVPVELDLDTDLDGGAAAEAALFYVVCESLVNVAKHASAHGVRVVVRRQSGGLVATISDDGCGGAAATGGGLSGLADRLATLGGRLRVQSAPGAGTTVTASVPVVRSPVS